MKPTFLNIALLDDQPLRFAYGISASHGKDGNRLLAELGAIFEQEYLIRQGKLAIIDKRKRIPLDFSAFEIADLKQSFVVFAALTDTFQKQGGHKPSIKLFKTIAMLCHASMEARAGIGLA